MRKLKIGSRRTTGEIEKYYEREINTLIIAGCKIEDVKFINGSMNTQIFIEYTEKETIENNKEVDNAKSVKSPSKSAVNTRNKGNGKRKKNGAKSS